MDVIRGRGKNLLNTPAWKNGLSLLQADFEINTEYSGEADLYLTIAGVHAVRNCIEAQKKHYAPICARVIGDSLRVRRNIRGIPSVLRLAVTMGALFRKIDYFSPCSSTVLKFLHDVRVPSRKILDITPFPMDHHRFIKVPRQPGFRVGYIGRKSHEKGADKIMKLVESMPNISFDFAGNGWGSMPDNCTVNGWLEGQDLIDFYNRIHVIILPSMSETIGYVTLEALLMGIPVISSLEARPAPISSFYKQYFADTIEDYINWIQEIKENGSKLLDHRGAIIHHFGMQSAGYKLIKSFREITEKCHITRE